MCLNEELLENCEEFLNGIANEEENEQLTHAIESLKEFIENDVDGRTSNSNDELVFAVQSRLEEIFDLISEEEKCANHLMASHYHELMEYLDTFQPQLEVDDGYVSKSWDDSDDDEELEDEDL